MTLPQRVIIYRLGSLGDTIAALPCFHLIQRTFPESERIVLTNVPVSRAAAPLEVILKEGGFIHGAIPYPLGTRDPRTLLGVARRLRAEKTTTLVYLAASRGLPAAYRDVAFFRACGFRRIIGAPLTNDLQRNRIDDRGEVEHESERLGRTLAQLGRIDLSDRTWWDLRLTDCEKAEGAAALGVLHGAPFIAVSTGGKAAEKDWGEPNWAAVLGELSSQLSEHGLLFVGAFEDRERAQRLREAWHAGTIVDLCGRVSPRVSAAALSGASVFVGHDSGPLHLADSVGVPAIGLFGDFNRPKMWHPSGPTTEIIHRMEGLASITPGEVSRTALRLAR